MQIVGGAAPPAGSDSKASQSTPLGTTATLRAPSFAKSAIIRVTSAGVKRARAAPSSEKYGFAPEGLRGASVSPYEASPVDILSISLQPGKASAYSEWVIEVGGGRATDDLL
jgi:hypothetical protein